MWLRGRDRLQHKDMRFSRRSARVYAQGDDADSMAAEWAEHEGEARMFAELRKNQRLLLAIHAYMHV